MLVLQPLSAAIFGYLSMSPDAAGAYNEANMALVNQLRFWIIALTFYFCVIRHRKPWDDMPKSSKYSLRKSGYVHTMQSSCEDPEICCQHLPLACCCLWPKMADNLATTGLMNYWVTMVMLALAQILGPLILVVVPNLSRPTVEWIWTGYVIFLAMLLAFLRGKMKVKFEGGDVGFIRDSLLYLLCTCCIAIQDTKQIDESIHTRVECICRLVQTDTPGGKAVVGGSVKIGSSATRELEMTGLASMEPALPTDPGSNHEIEQVRRSWGEQVEIKQHSRELVV